MAIQTGMAVELVKTGKNRWHIGKGMIVDMGAMAHYIDVLNLVRLNMAVERVIKNRCDPVAIPKKIETPERFTVPLCPML